MNSQPATTIDYELAQRLGRAVDQMTDRMIESVQQINGAQTILFAIPHAHRSAEAKAAFARLERRADWQMAATKRLREARNRARGVA